MATHDLKTWPEFFDAVRSGYKTFEVRRNDRDYRAGDTLNLRRWDPNAQAYTGDVYQVAVMYVLDGPGFGLQAGYCVMSIQATDAQRRVTLVQLQAAKARLFPCES